MMNMMLVGAVNVYLFKDYFNSAASLSIVGIIQTVTAFVAIPLAKPLVAKFGKKEIACSRYVTCIRFISRFILLT